MPNKRGELYWDMMVAAGEIKAMCDSVQIICRVGGEIKHYGQGDIEDRVDSCEQWLELEYK